MKSIKKIAVFCGANPNAQIDINAVSDLAEVLVAANVSLVYGGGNVGICGKLADAVLQRGGKAIGVMTQFLVNKEIAHSALSELLVVDSMQERKALMTDKADGFIMMPGGFGTFDEFFEVLTLAQLGLHTKPCGIFNIDNFFDHLLKFIDHGVKQGYVSAAHRDMLFVSQNASELLSGMMRFQGPKEIRWQEKLVSVTQ